MSSQTCLLPLFPSKESVKLCLLLSVYMFFFYCYGLNYDTVDFFICLKHCPVRAVCANFLIGEDITVTHCCLHQCHLNSGVYQYTCLSGIHYISQYYLFLSLHKNSKNCSSCTTIKTTCRMNEWALSVSVFLFIRLLAHDK